VPAWDFRTPIPGRGLCQWLDGEREAGLERVQATRPSAELEQLVRSATCLMVSSLRRAIESAKIVAPDVTPVIDEHFSEAALPCAIQSRLRFPPLVWAAFARTAWFCGWSPGVESFTAARTRAALAAGILHARAQRQSSVVLIGHGLMNILIARELQALGWRGPRFPRPRHWAFAVYVH